MQDGFQIGGDFGGQAALLQLGGPGFDLRVLLLFALDGGQCLLEGFFGRGFENAFGFFVEIHRRGIQRHQRGGQLDLAGRVAEIVFGDGFGGKFGFAAHFPQQIGVDLLRFGLGFFQKFGHGHAEFGKYVVGFHFGAFAVLGVHLVGGIVFLHHGGHFELAGFFVKNIHKSSMSKLGRYSNRLAAGEM